ncbi:MAG TPA: TonB family protein [Candidatus Sulfotelmatobacter sp.]
MSEFKTRAMVGNTQNRVPPANPQRRRLLLALVLLVVALVAVVLKDQQFWFGSDESTLETDGPAPAVASKTVATPAPVATTHAKSSTAKAHIPSAKTAAEPKPADAPAVITNRTVLPPLDVEVIAGDAHSRIHPGTNAAKVELNHPAMVAPEQSTLATATNAAEHERMAVEATTSTAGYPALAQHMNVQGSVVLQAVIGTDGVIQNLRVLSGPAILSAAAQQAVREWRFKPVVQGGQPVETKAKITVNFTIKVADGAANTTLADSRGSNDLIITR